MTTDSKNELLTVLYGTQTGCAESLAYTLCSLALKRGFKQCRCIPADEFPLERWKESSPVVIITSNANQGEAPETMRVSWIRLLEPNAPSMDGLRFAVFGVGDSLYQKFNYMAKMLHNRLKQLGGVPLVNRGLGDESDAKGHDEVFLPWMIQLWKSLGKLCSSENELTTEDPLKAPLLTKYNVSMSDEVVKQNTEQEEVYRNEAVFDCIVRQNHRLTAQDHFQVVHHLVFSRDITRTEGGIKETKSLSYEVGDALGIYCSNNDEMIESFLAQTKYNGDMIICITPNISEGLIQQKNQPFFGKPMKLRFFLRHYLDLEAVANRSFLGMLARFTKDHEIRERLLELASSDHLDEFMSYSHREKRNVVEVLGDFHMVSPPLATLLSYIPPMRPRLFSIASSPSFDLTEIHLTVAQISWETPYKRRRQGLCSSRLVSSVPKDIFTCFLWSGTLLMPMKPSPLLCVGTGTGIAPIRSIIRECAANLEEWGDVPILLFFGCRYEKKDYLYHDDWVKLSRDRLKQMKVIPAFSRDGEKKFYVQHQLGQHARRVAKLLDEGAYIYICGNSTTMPKDVASTLENIVIQCSCAGDDVSGHKYMKDIHKQGRYVVDTWSA
ncbi:Flavodoxin/nitric oxide synthase [Trypanosoma melophagium]|uniref:Flavodoxin/nitric oxide synthase n=1 Tax=Trypanosoma melophagium TaxID=715481 RepID=UPI00351A048E|nr:Flavodoxin/nitric oxide synthase [Trypanosoma melophagium]